MFKNALSLLLLLALLFSPLTALGISYSDLYVFGDSLSDQGNDFAITSSLPIDPVPPLEYSDGTYFGRFTNGSNYIDHLADSLGLSSVPSLLGGNNFAYGGARTYYQRPELSAIGALSLLGQKDDYLTRLGAGVADPNALYIVWAGANNLGDILEPSLALDPNTEITKTLVDISTVVSSLAAKGAKHFIVPNLPNIGLTPLVASAGAAAVAGATFITETYNAGFNTMLDGIELLYTDIDLLRFDTFDLFNNLMSDPALYGFINTSDPCYSEFVAPGGTMCGNPDEYVFWDAFHPSAGVHEILGQEMLAAASPAPVPEPSTWILLGFGLLGLEVYRRKANKFKLRR